MDSITVSEAGTPLTFTFADLTRYQGPGFPGGVAHAPKAAFPLPAAEVYAAHVAPAAQPSC